MGSLFGCLQICRSSTQDSALISDEYDPDWRVETDSPILNNYKATDYVPPSSYVSVNEIVISEA
jgi:hypothetical protein